VARARTDTQRSSLTNPSATPQRHGRPVFCPGRVDPRFDVVYQLENSSRSTYNGFTLSINKRYNNDSALLASYAASLTTDDASDFDEQPASLRPAGRTLFVTSPRQAAIRFKRHF